MPEKLLSKAEFKRKAFVSEDTFSSAEIDGAYQYYRYHPGELSRVRTKLITARNRSGDVQKPARRSELATEFAPGVKAQVDQAKREARTAASRAASPGATAQDQQDALTARAQVSAVDEDLARALAERGVGTPQWALSANNGQPLSEIQLRAWRDAYYRNRGFQTKPMNQFLAEVASVGPDVESSPAFQALSPILSAVGRGARPGETVFQTGPKMKPGNIIGGLFGGPTKQNKVSIPSDAASLASSYNGTAAKLMPDIVRAAHETSVPWQLIWGVLRAQSGFNSRVRSDAKVGIAGMPENEHRPGGKIGDSVDWVARKLLSYYQQLGDWGLAALAIDDPDSAFEFKRTGRPLEGHGVRNALYIRQVMGDGKSTKTAHLAQLGFGEGEVGRKTVPIEFIESFGEGSQSGSGAASITLPDRTLIRQQADTLFRTWFRRNPQRGESDLLADGILQMMSQAAMQAQAGKSQGVNPYAPSGGGNNGATNVVEDVDAQARLQEALRNTPEYRELFANKPTYLSEEQYGSQFENQGAAFLGKAPPDEAVRLGMRTNNPDLVEGYLAGTQMAAPGQEQASTKTFRQRLYEAASLIQRIT